MTLRSMSASLLAFSLGAVAIAQCPHQVARQVPEEATFFGGQSCGGVKFMVEGVTLSTPMGSCPLFARYSPPHSVADFNPSSATRVLDAGPAGDTLVIFFKCQTDYLLFIPLGSSCVVDRVVIGAALRNLSTAGC